LQEKNIPKLRKKLFNYLKIIRKKNWKKKLLKALIKNNGIINNEDDDNGIEMKESDQLNDSSTNLADLNLNQIEISINKTNST
jgi:hypothetical protein